MAATYRELSYDALLTTTADKIHKSGAIQDAITNSNPTFKALMESGKIKKVTVGGDQIRVPLMYQHNGTIASYSDYDQIDITPQDGITTAYLPWAQYGGAVAISGIQKFKNMGPEQIADLLKAKISQTTAGWSETLNYHLMNADATLLSASHPYTGNSGKDIIGLPLWVQNYDAAAVDDYDIGNIDQSVETWWKNRVGTPAADSYVGLKNAMRNLYNDCSQGPGGAPDLIIADQVSFEIYEAAMDPQVRYTFKDTASAGFENVAFKGAKMYWDGYVPDMYTTATPNGVLSTGSALAEGSMFFLNTKTMTMYVGKDHDWKPRGFQTPVDQDASVSLYLAYVQLVCDNRRKNGVLHSIEPSIAS
jgi:hypothetical protein